ncbi:YaaL family protein [Bacillus sp. 2205SS5-2]|uniref:YaaL family protein n=1 Tax=Bacillus sp. 2205SS5-2 TaxID=3109031 RepID=UPI003007EB4B
MFFRKRNKIRNEYDGQLINLMESTKRDWVDKRSIEEMSIDQHFDLTCQTKIAESKYFFLFKEAKKRKIVIKR